jgi:class 3 adenylate cyclase/predicted ATPase
LQTVNVVDIATWLRELDLERYEAAFRDNDIDLEILPKLTADDLLAIGVTSVGHRRRLLEAVAALPAAAVEPSAAVSISEAPDDKPRKSEAQRRQLTVMFVDLAGSTELSARLDPEDMGQVIRAYQVACAEGIERWDGHVAKYMGDGVLAYFGWPQAHEDDAERAVRAGLDVTDAVGKLAPPVNSALAARVGIATGLVMVGELFGEGAAREETVVGEVPNLAARLQTLAEPGTVVINQATRRLVAGVFELDDLGPKRLKGFAEPLAVWRIAGEGSAEGRFEARQTAGLTPLVGRDEEISLLLRRWRQARDGEGQVVLLSGEPGIGKSRLVRELRERLSEEPHIRLLYQCSPHHTTSPLHPVIEQLERAAGFERDDPPAARLEKLEALLARGTDQLDQAALLIAALLGLPTQDRYPPLGLTPQRQKQLTLEALVDRLAGLAAEQPVLLAYEDAHWIDPTTQELLGLAIERVQRLAVLLLITFRPGFTPPWSGQPHLSALALTRLGRREGAAMVDQLVQDKALPDEVAAQIVAKTDGVPLFVEELTKTVLESGLLKDAGDRYELTGPLPPLAIPATLHDSLLARLDRLVAVKDLAQIGAAIGREFSHALLAAVADRPEPELHAALDQLVSSELVFRRGAPPEVTYSFKHALVQDAAYQSLLKSRRQQLHARIARALEEQPLERAAVKPEILAHHFTEAGLPERAIDNWLAAGQRALARSAYLEAIAHSERGLNLVPFLAEPAARVDQELKQRTLLGVALGASQGFSSAAMAENYARMKELCRASGQQMRLFTALWGLWLFESLIHTGSAEQLRLTLELVKLADETGFPEQLLQAHHAAWTTRLDRGEFAECWRHAQEGISRYDPESHKLHVSRYGGHDPGVCCRIHGALALWALGHPQQALAQSDQAIALARQLGHPASLAFAHLFGAFLRQRLGDPAAAEGLAQATMVICREHALLPHIGNAAELIRGWALMAEGRVDDGSTEMRRALAALQAVGAHKRLPYYLALLASALGQLGHLDEGLRLLSDARERARTTGEHWWDAEILRSRGDLLRQDGLADPSQVEECYREAIAIAKAQAAKSLELRAVTSLARLWRDHARRAEARELLAPVYGWFTEGFDTADLKDAKALLDELS